VIVSFLNFVGIRLYRSQILSIGFRL